jgi:hypothetical protein
MDIVLVVITCASVTAAAALGINVWRTRAEEQQRSAARVAALSAAIDGAEPKPSSGRSGADTSMFGATTERAVTGRPLIKAGIFAGLAVAFVVIVAMANRQAGTHAASAADPAPLELVTMSHTRSGRDLTVSGLVRNPRAGTSLTRIDAVVFAFDRTGGFVASGRAALDFTTLAPGDRSAFVVKIPNVADIARYRVSFRTEAGILRHLDRRAAAQLQASAR